LVKHNVPNAVEKCLKNLEVWALKYEDDIVDEMKQKCIDMLQES